MWGKKCMNKKIFGIVICMLFIATSFTSVANIQRNTGNLQPPIEWTETYGGSKLDVLHYMQATSDGGYIMVGCTYSEGVGNYDVSLIKTDINGHIDWSNTYGGTTRDEGYCVQQTTDNGYIICGESYQSSLDDEGYWIKTDANGNKQYEIIEPRSTNSDMVNCVQQTDDGGYISVGTTTDYSTSQVWLVKQYSNLYIQWTKNFGTNAGGSWIECTNDGGCIMIGYTESPTHRWQMLLSKIDKNGNEQWFKTFGGTNSEFGNYGIQTTDGGYVIVGVTESFGQGGADIYVIKTDEYGNKEWEKTIGTPGHELGNSIIQTCDGGYFIVGYSLIFGNQDVLAIKLDINGDVDWIDNYGGLSDEIGVYGQQTSDGGYIIAGSTASYGAGEADFWLIKLETQTNRPNIPTITGRNNLLVNKEYEFTFISTDPDSDDIFYTVDWGDGNLESWNGPHNSGTALKLKHTYLSEDNFLIKCKVRDINGAESSNWGVLNVNTPKDKSTTSRFLDFLSNTFPIFEKILNNYCKQ